MSHYEALGVQENSSLQDIRRAYKAVCLAYHPDKLRQTANESVRAESAARLSAAQAALAVLGDADLRQEYDRTQRLVKNPVITDSVSLAEFDIMTQPDDPPEYACWMLECRCGGSYTLSESDRASNVSVIVCDTCSLAIQIIN